MKIYFRGVAPMMYILYHKLKKNVYKIIHKTYKIKTENVQIFNGKFLKNAPAFFAFVKNKHTYL